MSYTVNVYKNGKKYGSGTAANAGLTVTSYSAETGMTLYNGMNVQVTATTGSCVGATENKRLISGAGTATLTFDKAHCFA